MSRFGGCRRRERQVHRRLVGALRRGRPKHRSRARRAGSRPPARSPRAQPYRLERTRPHRDTASRRCRRRSVPVTLRRNARSGKASPRAGGRGRCVEGLSPRCSDRARVLARRRSLSRRRLARCRCRDSRSCQWVWEAAKPADQPPSVAAASTGSPGNEPTCRSGPCECGDPVESGELVRVADRVDAGDATVLDGEAHCGVDLTADVEPDGG